MAELQEINLPKRHECGIDCPGPHCDEQNSIIDNWSPYILNLDSWQGLDLDEVVIDDIPTLVMGCPLDTKLRFKLKSKGGITRRKLCKFILLAFQETYRREGATVSIHTIEDFALEQIFYNPDTKEITLSIGT